MLSLSLLGRTNNIILLLAVVQCELPFSGGSSPSCLQGKQIIIFCLFSIDYLFTLQRYVFSWVSLTQSLSLSLVTQDM